MHVAGLATPKLVFNSTKNAGLSNVITRLAGCLFVGY
jgi:hypothetical protein